MTEYAHTLITLLETITMAYSVTDNKGTQIARYDHLSELQTFIKASYPLGAHSFDNTANGGVTTVFNEKNEEVGRIAPQVKPEEMPEDDE